MNYLLSLFFVTASLTPSSLSASQLFDLQFAPMVVRPTKTSVTIQLRNGIKENDIVLSYHEKSQPNKKIILPKSQLASWQFSSIVIDNLKTGREYQYQVDVYPKDDKNIAKSYKGRFVTARAKLDSFTMAIIADSHIGPFSNSHVRTKTLQRVVKQAGQYQPDFLIALGDNVAWPRSKRRVRNELDVISAYSTYRSNLGPLLQNTSYFGVIGNWEGENGIIPAEERRIASSIRKQFMPAPNHKTYPQGGSENEDYYAFDWGDALFIVLNVQTYSLPSKKASEIPRYLEVDKISDWTLGKKQMTWLKQTLASSRQKFKFIFIHHVVGGKGGNRRESLYGRGGGFAAYTGEQKTIHELMIKHGVQAFFYGHDHVFTESTVDGVRYILPGSAGAPFKFNGKWTGYKKIWKESGFALLKVSPDGCQVEFIDDEGKVLHQMEMKSAPHTALNVNYEK